MFSVWRPPFPAEKEQGCETHQSLGGRLAAGGRGGVDPDGQSERFQGPALSAQRGGLAAWQELGAHSGEGRGHEGWVWGHC